MADFLTALENTLRWEGGISNHPADKGGITAYGISKNNWPCWAGWEFVERGDKWEESEALRINVFSFYRVEFWDKIKGDQINNQGIANVLFDWSVTSGYHAAKSIQKIVNTPADGVIGPITTLLINKGCQEEIFNQLKEARIKFYKDIVARNESQRVFLKGWLNRTNSFTFQ